MSFEELRTQEEYFANPTAIPMYPRDNFADFIVEAAVCHSQLQGVIPMMSFDVQAGVGGVVQVPIIAARNAQGPLSMGSCQCLSQASSTFSKATVTIYRWGDYENMCEGPLYKAALGTKEAIINEMGKGLAHLLDHHVFWSMCTTGFTPGHHVHSLVSCNSTVTWASCCNYRYNLYNSVVSLKADMENHCYEPDYLILNPTVGAWFKKAWTQTNNELVTIGADGKLLNVAGLKVIETGVANPCSGAVPSLGLGTMAVIIDSKRALAEAWGKRPTFEESRDPHCDSYQEVVWLYWGIQRLDRMAIAHVVNT